MKQTDFKEQLPIPAERVKLGKPLGRRLFRLLCFIVCVAILVAAFAVTGIWASFSEPVQSFLGGIFKRERTTKQPSDETPVKEPSEAESDTTQPESSGEEQPDHAIPVVSRLLKEPVQAGAEALAPGETSPVSGQTPLVFLYCTNSKEAYWSNPASEGEIGAATFSEDPSVTVRAVAEKLLQTLTENGIAAIYGEPEESEGYLGSSRRAGELIQKALEEHPEITLVIEIGRDSLFDEEGNYIRTVTGRAEDQTAQVLAIVGSGENGVPCPAWQENLILAQTLGNAAEEAVPGIFRGVRVKSTSKNQQYAPQSLSLLFGSGANSLEEAMRAAEQIGKSLTDLLNLSK